MKIRAAIIGSGNIGTDLVIKARRSATIDPVWLVGIDPASDGLRRARELGLKTTHEGVDGLLPHVEKDNIQIAFDATSAHAHAETSRKLTRKGVLVVDQDAPVELAEVTCTGTTTPFTCRAPLPPLRPWQHTLSLIAAENTGPAGRPRVSQPSRPLEVFVMIQPIRPPKGSTNGLPLNRR